MSQVPSGYRLAPTTDGSILESPTYQHWTIADLVELFSHCPPEARLWVMDDEDTVHPLEFLGGDQADVMLS
ncbi:hypothetical protein [Leifsonia sp. NPDC080035]|uniref:Uncharacterized protein n=1 Tax=Leifsonia sp. NPDC080035 TaxID=3143936 RepID=A0AAU7GCV4_9MICO